MVREPRHGWMKVLRADKCWVLNECNKDNLINYQTKTVKDYYIEDENTSQRRIISNLEYFASYGLLKKLKKRSCELGLELRYLKRI
jgi:hypothetical protein